MIRIAFVLILSVAASMLSSAQEKGKEFPIDYFLGKEEKTRFTVSPDGESVAYLGVWKGRYNLFLDAINGGNIRQLTFFNEQDVVSYHWADNFSIALERSASAGVNSAVFLTSLTSGDVIELSSADYKARLVSNNAVRGRVVFASYEGNGGAPVVYSLSPSDMEKTAVYTGSGNEYTYCLNGEGILTALVQVNGDELVLSSSGFGGKPGKFGVFPMSDQLSPLVSSPGIKTDHLFISRNGKDRARLVSISLSEGARLKEVYSNDAADVVAIAYSSSSRKLFGVEYENGMEFKTHILDQSFTPVYDAVRKFVPGFMNIRFVNCDDKENVFVFKAWSARQRATYYRFNLSNNEVKLLGNDEDLKVSDFLSKRDEFKFKTRDQVELTGYVSYPAWNQGNCPVIVLVRDYPWIRACSGFDPLVQFLTSKGFVVYEAAFRGSGGNGLAYEQAGYRQWAGLIQSDIVDGIKAIQRRGGVSADKIAIIGSGFGGYSALRQACNPETLFACAVSMNGICDLQDFLKNGPALSPMGKQGDYMIIGNPENEAERLKNESPVSKASGIMIPVLLAYGDANATAVAQNESMTKKLNELGIVHYSYVLQGESEGISNEDNRYAYYEYMLNFIQQSFSSARKQRSK